jgi:uncharacterized membrane protein YqgA involved in biofilm formation
VIGTILNVGAILLGGIIGLTVTRDLPQRAQVRLKYILGVLVIYAGLSLTWKSVNGSFFYILKQIGVVFLALILGNAVGMALRLQKSLSKLGEYAGKTLTASTGNSSSGRFSEGFVACSLLFCVGPMAILGALQDGLTGNFRVLAIKSVMDGLATMAFARSFGWGVLLSAVPVLAYQGSISLAARSIEPFLQNQAMLDAINATGGLLVLCISLVVLEIAKVPLANYLPSLVVAPLLARWIL